MPPQEHANIDHIGVVMNNTGGTVQKLNDAYSLGFRRVKFGIWYGADSTYETNLANDIIRANALGMEVLLNLSVDPSVSLPSIALWEGFCKQWSEDETSCCDLIDAYSFFNEPHEAWDSQAETGHFPVDADPEDDLYEYTQAAIDEISDHRSANLPLFVIGEYANRSPHSVLFNRIEALCDEITGADAVAIHNYGYAADVPDWVDDALAKCNSEDIWVTEFNMTNSTDPHTTAIKEDQTDEIVEIIDEAGAWPVTLIYCYRDDGRYCIEGTDAGHEAMQDAIRYKLTGQY